MVGLFLFWQCVQVFDVLKHNVRQRVTFSLQFYLDAVVVLACAWVPLFGVGFGATWRFRTRFFLAAEAAAFVTQPDMLVLIENQTAGSTGGPGNARPQSFNDGRDR